MKHSEIHLLCSGWLRQELPTGRRNKSPFQAKLLPSFRPSLAIPATLPNRHEWSGMLWKRPRSYVGGDHWTFQLGGTSTCPHGWSILRRGVWSTQKWRRSPLQWAVFRGISSNLDFNFCKSSRHHGLVSPCKNPLSTCRELQRLRCFSPRRFLDFVWLYTKNNLPLVLWI